MVKAGYQGSKASAFHSSKTGPAISLHQEKIDFIWDELAVIVDQCQQGRPH